MEKETNKKKPANKNATSSKNTSTKKQATKSVESKKTTTKKVIKKPAVKKTEKEKPVVLSETVKPITEKVVTIEQADNLVECVHCHQKFEKGLTICPYCRKRQKASVGLIFFIVFACVFLLAIICFHFVDKYVIGTNANYEADYKKTCQLVDFENLVRHPKEYKNKSVKVIGTVSYVDGYDSGFGNNMNITINANLFDNDIEQLVTVSFNDKEYSQGFLVGDLITVYGEYTEINGNTPNIKAKYITFGR